MIAVNLYPRSAFHVGELGVGREETLTYVPSDTLYAALVMAWVTTGDAGPFDPPPLRLTSAFPRVGQLRLYPRPFVRLNVAREQRDKLGKLLLKFDWCSERIFALLIQGMDMTKLAEKSNFIAGVWFHPDEIVQLPPAPDGKKKQPEKFWDTKPPVPHVALDRRNNAPNLFYTGRVSFGPECGLWFGVEPVTPEAPLALQRALGYLADAGLGGLRSTGHGGFTFELSDFTIFNRNPSDYAVTLARYLPAGDAEVASTLQASHAAYKLVIVGGWCQDDTGHPWRRKQVRMVREGSIIGWNNKTLGYIANVVPELPPSMGQFGGRPVLRYGVPFPIPVAKEALL